jgi:hypothetical protein
LVGLGGRSRYRKQSYPGYVKSTPTTLALLDQIICSLGTAFIGAYPIRTTATANCIRIAAQFPIENSSEQGQFAETPCRPENNRKKWKFWTIIMQFAVAVVVVRDGWMEKGSRSGKLRVMMGRGGGGNK